MALPCGRSYVASYKEAIPILHQSGLEVGPPCRRGCPCIREIERCGTAQSLRYKWTCYVARPPLSSSGCVSRERASLMSLPNSFCLSVCCCQPRPTATKAARGTAPTLYDCPATRTGLQSGSDDVAARTTKRLRQMRLRLKQRQQLPCCAAGRGLVSQYPGRPAAAVATWRVGGGDVRVKRWHGRHGRGAVTRSECRGAAVRIAT